jgi:hypothetical protein
MTTYTFGKKNNKSFNSFHTSSKPNYSKILDNIIIADVINKNDYLFGKKNNTASIDSTLLGASMYDSKLDAAIDFLANYKKPKNYYLPFKLNTMYTLSDGTPIIFYDDEIQIGFDTFKYADFSSLDFINSLTPKNKKIIIDIYTFGNANVNINIL